MAFPRHKAVRFDFRKKMIITILPTLILIFVILGANIYFSNLRELEKRHRAEIRLLSYVLSEHVKNQFDKYFDKETFYNETLSEYKAVGINFRRKYYTDLTRKFLENNTDVTSYWLDFEEDSLDMQDANYGGKDGFNKKGRYNLCFQRGTGVIVREPISPADEGSYLEDDYIVFPKKAGKTIVLEPYYYSYLEDESNEMLMTTIASPIFNANKQIIGVSGIDISLESIVDFVNSIRPYEESYATLCTESGLYLAHPEPDFLGKNITDNDLFSKGHGDSVINKFAANKEFMNEYTTVATNERFFVYSIPIELGNTDYSLWINVHVPYKIIASSANVLLRWNMLLFVIAILLTTITIFIVSKKLSVPLRSINHELIKLASGDLSVKLNVVNNDEIGDIAKSTLFVNEIISGLISDINHLLQEAIKGNYDARVDVTKHPGDYKKILEYSNQIIDVLVRSINGIKKLQSELQESERKYKYVIDNSKDVLWTVDIATMRYVFVNDAICDALGYEKEEFLGKTVQETMSPEMYGMVENVILSLIEQSQYDKAATPNHTIELQKLNKGGHPVWMEISFKITQDATYGIELSKMVCAARIIEDRKALEFEVLAKQRELVKLNATKDRFFSIIAHDLKNPISSLLQLSEFLYNDLKSNKIEDLEEDVSMLTQTLKQTYDLLINLLEWSRSSRGDIVYSPTENSIAKLINSCQETLKAQALAKNIELIASAIPDIQVKCDYQMIQTIIRNLVSNAIKFSFADTKIELIVEDYKEDANYLQVSVKDAGVGISEDDIKKLFRIDEKIVSSRGTNDESGTGLGLILCKEFIDKHNCRIWVSSSIQGEGTTFSFTLPKV